jgi:hypothetical protein
MIHLALLSALSLAVVTALPAQKKKGSSAIAKVGLEDRFTGEDAKAMAKLGVVDYGPLVWADNKRTTDIETVLGDGRVGWRPSTSRSAATAGSRGRPRTRRRGGC